MIHLKTPFSFRHFIRVVRMNNSLMVKVNETVSINHEIPSPTTFRAEKLYLGNYPQAGNLPTPPPSTVYPSSSSFSPVVTSTTSAAPASNNNIYELPESRTESVEASTLFQEDETELPLSSSVSPLSQPPAASESQLNSEGFESQTELLPSAAMSEGER